MDDLRYPIGKYEPQPYSDALKNQWLQELSLLPQDLEMAVLNLDDHQLNTPYREGGWNIKQVVHHVADSHMNAYIRIKLALTEELPTIKPYEEAAWAELQDVFTVPVNVSLTLVHALHTRWVATIRNLSQQDWQRSVFHPEHNKQMTIWFLVGMYVWHGKHHVAHINRLRERNKW